MEDGGGSLFDFVKSAHKLIRLGILEISHWIQVVKHIFKQMIECIEFMHNKQACHFDISLENFLINDVDVNITKTSNGKQKYNLSMDSIQVKLCDFGMYQYYLQTSSFYNITLCLLCGFQVK